MKLNDNLTIRKIGDEYMNQKDVEIDIWESYDGMSVCIEKEGEMLMIPIEIFTGLLKNERNTFKK